MARIRTIKPEFWTDERLTECSLPARLLFIGMLNFADDNGNLAYSAKRLKMQIFPADSVDTQPLLDELLTHGVLMEYSVNGEKFLHIKGFRKHQVINRPSVTAIPKPQFMEDSLSTHGVLTEDSLTEGKGMEGSGMEGKGKEGKGECDSHKLTTGQVCMAMKSVGVSDVSPSHVGLAVLLEAGAVLQEFTDAASKAVQRGQGFRYALGIVEGERKKAASMATQIHKGKLPAAETEYQRSMRQRMAEAAPEFARQDPAAAGQDASAYFRSIGAAQVVDVQVLELPQ